ncbi:hypothetical protein N1F89_15480 [Aquibium sp. A9E412]|uniref:hypothetical protein n=1 Tax=Aquibium sp. A9E412 TaxID=2976767 RepID=UPI0025AF4EF9|nr:hypothetical protein [Aquibium sp. A9E412]MDN2567624.1 hypothetical protein [Aquibium sp. A9E412]
MPTAASRHLEQRLCADIMRHAGEAAGGRRGLIERLARWALRERSARRGFCPDCTGAGRCQRVFGALDAACAQAEAESPPLRRCA